MCLPMQAYIHYPDHDAASRALEALEGKPMALAGVKTVSFAKLLCLLPRAPSGCLILYTDACCMLDD